MEYSKKSAITALLTMALLSSLVAACTSTADFDTLESQPHTEISPETIPEREARECPALDSQLFQLTQADEPLRLAEQLGLRVKDEKVQVLLILVSEETGFLQDYGVELGTQSGNQAQAFVSIDQLCELANNDAVIAIRAPAEAFP
jgi:hypothetical protein